MSTRLRDQLMTAQEVVDELGLDGLHTLYRWRTDRKGPASAKIGRELRYRRRDVETWLNEQFAVAGAQTGQR